MIAKLKKFNYKYMEYEKQLQLREINAFFPDANVLVDDNQNTVIEGTNLTKDKLFELTYYSSFMIGDDEEATRQAQIEHDETLRVAKQHTRYSTHGIHEYKGKFNPQIVHALLNLLHMSKDSFVLDPFNGSGTTVLECTHAGIKSVGIDINPMACFISNAKIEALSVNVDEAEEVLAKVLNYLPMFNLAGNTNDDRITYLESWIPEDTLLALEGIKTSVSNENRGISDLFLAVASDLIRDYSFQEPSDLRIRRRTSPFPSISFVSAFESNVRKYLHRISKVQQLPFSAISKGYAINCDIKTVSSVTDSLFDAAITSPPYVTALPYVDTQRISLVWLGLCEASEIRWLETQLIGNREISKLERDKWTELMISNACNLPQEISCLTKEMYNELSPADGFRKQAVPALTYKYFSEMQEMFYNTKRFLKQDAPFALIVGHNKTTLGGKTFNINTPYLLTVLAEACGWKKKELTELQTYVRYGLNSKNSIGRESLIVIMNS